MRKRITLFSLLAGLLVSPSIFAFDQDAVNVVTAACTRKFPVSKSTFEGWIRHGNHFAGTNQTSTFLSSNYYAFYYTTTDHIVELAHTGLFTGPCHYNFETFREFLVYSYANQDQATMPRTIEELYRDAKMVAGDLARAEAFLEILGIRNELLQKTFSIYLDMYLFHGFNDRVAELVSIFGISLNDFVLPEHKAVMTANNQRNAQHLKQIKELTDAQWAATAAKVKDLRGYVLILNQNAGTHAISIPVEANSGQGEAYLHYGPEGIPASDIAAIIPQGTLEKDELKSILDSLSH